MNPLFSGRFEGVLGLAIGEGCESVTEFLRNYKKQYNGLLPFAQLRSAGNPNALACNILALLLSIQTDVPPLEWKWFTNEIDHDKKYLQDPTKLNQVAKKLSFLIMKFRILPKIWLKMEMLPLDLASGIIRELVELAPLYEDVLAHTFWDQFGILKQTTTTNLTLLGPMSKPLAKNTALLRILADSLPAKDRTDLYEIALKRFNDPEVRGEQRVILGRIMEKLEKISP